MLVTGAVMFGIGMYVAWRPLWTHNSILTGARWLDIAFAGVFMLRGAINIRHVLQAKRKGPGGGPAT